MHEKKAPVNFNSVILMALIGTVVFYGQRTIMKVDESANRIIKIEAVMVTRQEYDVDMLTLKAKVAAIELYIQQRKDGLKQ